MAPLTDVPEWMSIARAFQDCKIQEVPGADAHPLITAFLRHFTQLEHTNAAESDETPWCSAFACACMELSGNHSPHHALARSWLNWGQSIQNPRYGCVVVLKDSNHVGFYVNHGPSKVSVLGGNQRNTINVTAYDIGRVVSYRWPRMEGTP